MRFTTAALALLLAVATASPVPEVNEAEVALKDISTLPVVDVDYLLAVETRDLEFAHANDARAVDEAENSLEARVWPHDHQSGIFKIGHGYAARVVTGIIINGVNVAVTAWANDLHTLFLQFSPAFPSAPVSIRAGLEDLSTGFLRSPWTIRWDELYALKIQPGEIIQYDNNYVMNWK